MNQIPKRYKRIFFVRLQRYWHIGDYIRRREAWNWGVINISSMYFWNQSIKRRGYTWHDEGEEHQDYFESWFQEATKLQHHFLQHLLLHKQVSRLVLHIQVIIATAFSYVDKGIFLILLRTWLHWKNSYTWKEMFSFFLGRIGKYVYK